MRTGLDHVPDVQQLELARVVEILMEEFGAAIARATQPSRRNGKNYKIVFLGTMRATTGSTRPTTATSRISTC